MPLLVVIIMTSIDFWIYLWKTEKEKGIFALAVSLNAHNRGDILITFTFML